MLCKCLGLELMFCMFCTLLNSGGYWPWFRLISQSSLPQACPNEHFNTAFSTLRRGHWVTQTSFLHFSYTKMTVGVVDLCCCWHLHRNKYKRTNDYCSIPIRALWCRYTNRHLHVSFSFAQWQWSYLNSGSQQVMNRHAGELGVMYCMK